MCHVPALAVCSAEPLCHVSRLKVAGKRVCMKGGSRAHFLLWKPTSRVKAPPLPPYAGPWQQGQREGAQKALFCFSLHPLPPSFTQEVRREWGVGVLRRGILEGGRLGESSPLTQDERKSFPGVGLISALQT